VHLRESSSTRRAGTVPSAPVSRPTPGPSRAAPPRPLVPEAGRAQPIPLMGLWFPSSGRGGSAPRAAWSPTGQSPARPASRNVMGIQAFLSLAGWHPQMPDVRPSTGWVLQSGALLLPHPWTLAQMICRRGPNANPVSR